MVSAANAMPMKMKLRHRGRHRGAHQHRIVALRAVERDAALHDAEREGEHQRVVADFGSHCVIPFPAVPVFLPASSFQCPCCLRRSATSRGM